MNSLDLLPIVSPGDALNLLREWIRTERQRRRWTQSELAHRSGVPAATISRLELTGLGSTDAVCKVLFALERLDALADFLKNRQRLAELPVTLQETPSSKPILRVRSRKERK